MTRMFLRAIDRCRDCPHLHFKLLPFDRDELTPIEDEVDVCPICEMENKDIPSIDTVPDWCPLPEVCK